MFAAGDSQSVGRDVSRDHTSCGNDRTSADRDGRDQRAVGSDKRTGADLGLVLEEAIIVAGNRSCADVGACADVGVTKICQMVGLGAWTHRRFLYLDEIADLGLFTKHGTGAKARERTDFGTLADSGSLEMAEGTDRHLIGQGNARTEVDIRFENDVAADLCVPGKPNRFRDYQGCAAGHHFGPPRSLPIGLDRRQLGATVYPGNLGRGGFDKGADPAPIERVHDDVR